MDASLRSSFHSGPNIMAAAATKGGTENDSQSDNVAADAKGGDDRLEWAVFGLG